MLILVTRDAEMYSPYKNHATRQLHLKIKNTRKVNTRTCYTVRDIKCISCAQLQRMFKFCIGWEDRISVVLRGKICLHFFR